MPAPFGGINPEKLYGPILEEWEKIKDKPISGSKRDEWQAAQAKVLSMQSNGLFNDARLVALKMTRDDNRDVDNYVDEELTLDIIPKYWDAVKKLAKMLFSLPNEQRNKILDLDQATVLPGRGSNKGDGGGGALGMGAPPPMPMAFNRHRIKTSGHSMFLVRDDGRYRMQGTLTSKILSGDFVYLRSDGISYVLKITDPEILVSRQGSAAKAAIHMEETLSGELVNVIVDFLKKRNKSDARQIAKWIVSGAPEKGSLDFRPCQIALSGVSLSIAHIAGAPVKEPKELQELRERIGQVFEKHIDSILAGLKEDKIDVQERRLSLPSHKNKEDIEDRDPEGHPRILTAEEAETCADARCLIMTILSSESEEEAKRKALDNAAMLLCRFPKFFKYRIANINADELMLASSRLPESTLRRKMERVAKLLALVDADDADLMKEYTEDETNKFFIAELIGAQNRTNIISAAPEIALQEIGINRKLIESVFNKLNPKDAQSRAVIKDVARLCLEKEIVIRDRHAFEGGIIRAILIGNDSELAKTCALFDGLPAAFALVWMIEHGTLPAIRRLKEVIEWARVRNHNVATLIALALVKYGGDAACKLAKEFSDIKPSVILGMLGKIPAAKYMKATRLGTGDTPVPESTNIVEIPDDPIGLAKDLAAIQDIEGMLSLLKLCSEKADSKDKQFQYVSKFLAEALRKSGHEQKVIELYTPDWARKN